MEKSRAVVVKESYIEKIKVGSVVLNGQIYVELLEYIPKIDNEDDLHTLEDLLMLEIEKKVDKEEFDEKMAELAAKQIIDDKLELLIKKYVKKANQLSVVDSKKYIFLKNVQNQIKKQKPDSEILEVKLEKSENEWYIKGKDLFSKEKYNLAIDAYDRALEQDIKNQKAWYAKGTAFIKVGKVEEADKCFEKAEEIAYNTAIEKYNREIELDSKNVFALKQKGDMLEALKRYEEAIKCYDKALNINIEDENIWFSKGLCFWKLKRYEEAIKCYDNVLEITPEDEFVWENKGFVFYDLERYKEAINCYDKALEIDPKESSIWYHKGNAFEKLDKPKKAEKCFAKVKE